MSETGAKALSSIAPYFINNDRGKGCLAFIKLFIYTEHISELPWQFPPFFPLCFFSSMFVMTNFHRSLSSQAHSFTTQGRTDKGRSTNHFSSVVLFPDALQECKEVLQLPFAVLPSRMSGKGHTCKKTKQKKKLQSGRQETF